MSGWAFRSEYRSSIANAPATHAQGHHSTTRSPGQRLSMSLFPNSGSGAPTPNPRRATPLRYRALAGEFPDATPARKLMLLICSCSRSLWTTRAMHPLAAAVTTLATAVRRLKIHANRRRPRAQRYFCRQVSDVPPSPKGSSRSPRDKAAGAGPLARACYRRCLHRLVAISPFRQSHHPNARGVQANFWRITLATLLLRLATQRSGRAASFRGFS